MIYHPGKKGKTYCLGCKKCRSNENPEKVKTTNQVLRDKSNKMR